MYNLVEKPAERVPEFVCPEYKKLSEYGYIRTIADVIKVLNQQNHYTDPKVLESDLMDTIEPYRLRGTVTQSSIDAVRVLIHDYEFTLFCRNELDMNTLVELICRIPSEGRSPIDDVFSIREKAKILYAIKFANKICKYTNPKDLVYDLQGLLWGKSNWGGHSKLLDDNYPHIIIGIRSFLSNLTEVWQSVSRNGVFTRILDNDLLESYMFTNHEKKIQEKGLVQTLKDDYDEVHGCHATMFYPKQPGTGPYYVVNRNNQIVKACHPSGDTLIEQIFYERGFVAILLQNMIKRNEYKEIEVDRECFYIPVRDFSRPVLHWDGEEMNFESEQRKIDFIKLYL